AIAVQAAFIRPEYFANPSLFPTWPVFDSERALSLFVVSMAIVLAPKAFGWFAALINIPRCLRFGGPILLTLSTLLEMVMSALYAPILMVSQFGVVLSIFRGKDSGWMPQSRDDGALSWMSVMRAHLGHTVFGVALALTALSLSTELFYWLLPITIGLMLSIPLSWLSGGARRTKWIKTVGLLRAPEEKKPVNILVKVKENEANLSHLRHMHPFSRLVNNPLLLKWHLAQLPDVGEQKPTFYAPRIIAEWKLNHAESLPQLESWLEPAEVVALLSNADYLQKLKIIGN
ncbi:glucans biosynthesis glucosyltransferase MdoH, partial [Shewanella sp. SR41-2]|nr:glucans biosynthesis glucosyltransferase MdoH [Shewanella sp. SR41-2]